MKGITTTLSDWSKGLKKASRDILLWEIVIAVVVVSVIIVAAWTVCGQQFVRDYNQKNSIFLLYKQ